MSKISAIQYGFAMKMDAKLKMSPVNKLEMDNFKYLTDVMRLSAVQPLIFLTCLYYNIQLLNLRMILTTIIYKKRSHCQINKIKQIFSAQCAYTRIDQKKLSIGNNIKFKPHRCCGIFMHLIQSNHFFFFVT